MKTFKALAITIAILAGTAAPAVAGDRSCSGTIEAGKEWTTVDQCRFKTNSKVGRRILAICPNGVECSIDNDLDVAVSSSGVMTLTKTPYRIEKTPPYTPKRKQP
jgi:hypothetical protein